MNGFARVHATRQIYWCNETAGNRKTDTELAADVGEWSQALVEVEVWEAEIQIEQYTWTPTHAFTYADMRQL